MPNHDTNSFDSEILEEAINDLLESDDYYTRLATPLKSAQQLKEEHRAKIREILQLQEFRKQIRRGIDLIFEETPNELTQDQLNQLAQEFGNMEKHAQENVNEMVTEQEKGNPVTYQKLFGISDGSMIILYDVGRSLLEQQKPEEALSVFSILAFLNPYVPEYLLGQALCFYGLNRFEEALVILEMGHLLDPSQAAFPMYSALCHAALNQLDHLQQDLVHAEESFENSETERQKWEETYLQLKNI